MAVTARQVEAPIIQYAHDLGHGSELQEHFEHKPQPFLNRHVGILDDQAARIAHEANRPASSPRPALASRPVVNRLRIVCSSSSDIVPFEITTYCPATAA